MGGGLKGAQNGSQRRWGGVRGVGSVRSRLDKNERGNRVGETRPSAPCGRREQRGRGQNKVGAVLKDNQSRYRRARHSTATAGVGPLPTIRK